MPAKPVSLRGRIGRRAFLSRGAILAGSAAGLWTAFRRTASASDANLPPHVPQWMTEQGTPIVNPAYGVPSPFEHDVVRRPRAKTRTMTAASSSTPLQDLHGIITPNGLHFERHHAGVPAIDPDTHRLLVHGLVERPLTFTMNDLTRFPSVSRLHFLECSGNSFWTGTTAKSTVQETHGLLSCCEWTGVLLSTVLAEAGVKENAKWILAEGADAAGLSRSVPIEKALDDALLVYAQNGERLRPEQGYPLRLLLPGYEGNMNVKYLRRLKLTTEPAMSYYESRTYAQILPNGKSYRFYFLQEVKSFITAPSHGHVLKEPGYYEISGIAYSGTGRIAKVMVSADGGKSWAQAALQEPVLPKAFTRFRMPWRWDGGPAVLQSRAFDESGAKQPTRAEFVALRGETTKPPSVLAFPSQHFNAITSWAVDAKGTVRHVYA